MIAADGAEVALRQLVSDGSSGNQLYDGIATGGEGWLRVAEQLRPVSDGAVGESLIMAIQEALPNNPAGVLKLVQRRVFTAQDACGDYGFGQIEDERPTAVIMRLVDRRIKTVTALQLASLAQERKACLDELAQLRTRVAGK